MFVYAFVWCCVPLRAHSSVQSAQPTTLVMGVVLNLPLLVFFISLLFPPTLLSFGDNVLIGETVPPLHTCFHYVRSGMLPPLPRPLWPLPCRDQSTGLRVLLVAALPIGPHTRPCLTLEYTRNEGGPCWAQVKVLVN